MIANRDFGMNNSGIEETLQMTRMRDTWLKKTDNRQNTKV